MIIAFGSSSTQGYGISSPEFTYPNRLAAQLRRKYPTADITVINRGRGGDDAREMMKRLQNEVIDCMPDMVIWQVGTNAVIRDLDPDATALLVQDGVARIQAAGADVVLVDPQYSPRVTEHPESASKMVRLLSRVAQLRHIGVFPRFEVMRQWHENQALPIDNFVIADGLHMNDWGYACFAQLLGDDIIRSVGQIKLGVNVPSDVRQPADVTPPGRRPGASSARTRDLHTADRRRIPDQQTHRYCVAKLRVAHLSRCAASGASLHAFSSAACKSSIRSSACSRPVGKADEAVADPELGCALPASAADAWWSPDA